MTTLRATPPMPNLQHADGEIGNRTGIFAFTSTISKTPALERGHRDGLSGLHIDVGSERASTGNCFAAR
jgi:hypothetical protein